MQLRKTSTMPGFCKSKPASADSDAVVRMPKSLGGRLVTPSALAKFAGGTSGRIRRRREMTCRWILAEPVEPINHRDRGIHIERECCLGPALVNIWQLLR